MTRAIGEMVRWSRQAGLNDGPAGRGKNGVAIVDPGRRGLDDQTRGDATAGGHGRDAPAAGRHTAPARGDGRGTGVAMPDTVVDAHDLWVNYRRHRFDAGCIVHGPDERTRMIV